MKLLKGTEVINRVPTVLLPPCLWEIICAKSKIKFYLVCFQFLSTSPAARFMRRIVIQRGEPDPALDQDDVGETEGG